MIKLNGVVVEQNHFPDGTLLIKGEPFGKTQAIEWVYESDAELFTVYCLKRHIDRVCREATVYLEMWYIPNARQDRVKSPNDVFTLKYFAEIINSLNFYSVHVLDPHSPVSIALIDRVRVFSPTKLIESAIDSCSPDLLFFPDEGAMKRYSDCFAMKNAFGVKRRDWENGKIEGLDVLGCVDDIEGKTVLIVDDICSRGGTFYHSAKKLKELGAKEIYLYITHCENTILEGEVLTSGLIEKVYTTKSIFTKEHEKIEVIECL